MHGQWTNDPTRRGRRRRPWRTAARRRGHTPATDAVDAPSRTASPGRPTAQARAPGAPGPRDDGADQGGPVSSPPVSADHPRRRRCGHRASPGAPLARPPVSGGGASLVPQLVLALVCGGIRRRCRARLGFARSRPDHGRLRPERRGRRPPPSPASSTPAPAAAASGPPGCCSRSPPRWRRSATRVWGWYEVVLERAGAQPLPRRPVLPAASRRPPSSACWCSPSGRSPGPVGSASALDAWLIGGSLLTLSWSLALAHTAKFDGPSVAHAALSLAYPLLDIALVSMVLALHFRRSAVNRTAVNTAIGALALTVMCDALFTSPLLHDSYHSGQLLDAGWFAGSLLLAYAPWAAPLARAAAGRRAHARGARAPAGQRAGATAPAGRAGRRSQPVSGHPAHRRLAGRAHARIWPPPSARWGSSTTSSTAAASTAWCSSPAAPSCSPSSCARASCCSTTSPSPRNWPRRRTTSAPWSRAPATSS